MHSRIFQFSRKKIEKNDYYDAERYYNGERGYFAGEYADIAEYVDDDTDRINDIKYLGEHLAGIVEFISEDCFKIINKKKYFEKKYQNFLKAVENLQNITEKEYINGNNKSLIRELEDSYSEKFDYYFDEYDQTAYIEFFGPMDDFMRKVQDGEIYYIGSSIDYDY